MREKAGMSGMLLIRHDLFCAPKDEAGYTLCGLERVSILRKEFKNEFKKAEEAEGLNNIVRKMGA